MLAQVANDLAFTTRQLTHSSQVVQYPFSRFRVLIFVSPYILRIYRNATITIRITRIKQENNLRKIHTNLLRIYYLGSRGQRAADQIVVWIQIIGIETSAAAGRLHVGPIGPLECPFAFQSG